jgi:hypothetical protein
MNPAALETYFQSAIADIFAMFNARPRRKRTQKRLKELSKFAKEIDMPYWKP